MNTVGGVNVSLRNFVDDNLYSTVGRFDGTYFFRGVPPGDLKLRTQLTAGYATSYYTASGPTATVFDNGSFVHVNPGQSVTGKNIAITPATGRIVGRVT